MKKHFLRRGLSLLLAVTMCVTLPLSVVAEELEMSETNTDVAAILNIDITPAPKADGTSTGTVKVETSAGKQETVAAEAETKTTSQPDGSTKVETTVKAEEQKTNSGKTVNYEAESTVVTDSEGTVTGNASEFYTVNDAEGTYFANGGSETEVKEQTPELSVDVPMTEDDPATEEKENENTATGDPVGTKETTGDEPTGSKDGEYDYETTEVVGQASVTATTDSVEFTEKAEVDMNYVNGTATTDNGSNDMYNFPSGMMSEEEIAAASKETLEEGYTHLLVGSDAFSRYSAAIVSKYRNPQYPDEEPVFVKDGVPYYCQRPHANMKKFIVDGFYLDGEYVDEEIMARWDYLQRFVFVDAETGEVFTTYCVDQQTMYEPGYKYNVENLEDADYYNEENAAKIRAVALNGYWGAEEGRGSLAALKKLMEESGQFSEEELAMVTDGLAMTATQYAIWNYSNEENGDDMISSFYIKNGASKPSALKDDQKDDVDLLFKLCYFLTNLEPDKPKGDTSDTIINQKNFVKDLAVKVIKKAENHANNKDANKDNDAYSTEISFALKVTPSGDKGESMLVEIIGKDGLHVKGRISGELQEGEIQLTEENGTYTFRNIIITEGDQTFSINLSGVQHLSEGVYIYTSEVKEGKTSQTMVGIASGERKYDINMDIKFSLDVKDEVVAKEHVWRSERRENTPATFRLRNTPAPDPDPDPDPEENEELEEIPDEEVPLADAPETGDTSLILAAISAMSGIGLAGLNLPTRRKKQ